MKLEFKIGGRRVNAHQFGKALEKEALKAAEKSIETQLKKIRDPETGQSLKVRKKPGTKNLNFEVTGSRRAIDVLKNGRG